MALDLSRFAKAFFEEAHEHVGALESLLLNIDIARPDHEALNAIFRAVHSIKGGAAAFGHKALAEFTHDFESILDRVRKGTLVLNKARVDAFLKAGDVMRQHLSAIENEQPADLAAMQAMRVSLLALAEDAIADAEVFEEPAQPVAAHAPPRYTISIDVERASYADVEALDALKADLGGLGQIRDFGSTAVDENRLQLVFGLDTDLDAEELRESLEFVVSSESMQIHANERRGSRAATPADDEEGSYGFFAAPPAAASPAAAAPPQDHEIHLATLTDASSIRVNVAKVDQLINLVGELVIAEAMIAQAGHALDPENKSALGAGLSLLERNTRELQEAVLAIRMLPISFVFSRLPRLVRDLADKLGKQVHLEMLGEETELDKSVIEKIADPLTHLVRNALDHGIEEPAERIARGKPQIGRMSVRAAHQGGNILIAVSDDGAGLDRQKILAKARAQGMSADESWDDAEVWQLIFAPGLSTATQVTDVSGRGVGMDVVWQNVHALGGNVDISSTAGQGTTMTIRLPLTLAILDGMSVRVSGETYILPLANIIQSIQPGPDAIKTVNGAELIMVRGEYLPITSLAQTFGLAEGSGSDRDILLVLEDSGRRAAIRIDELLGQHQVVLKSLEANYRKVKGVSGATIMGDGHVAFILDAPYLVSLAHSQAQLKTGERLAAYAHVH
ncbi:MAG TPA: chemotaxis protein CheW [Usitatibacteraceae bacterium]|nr:chemotaxis protein CheW [Usitatibacteraceae bacterium]